MRRDSDVGRGFSRSQPMNHDSSHHPVVETTESNPARRLITPSYQQLLSLTF